MENIAGTLHESMFEIGRRAKAEDYPVGNEVPQELPSYITERRGVYEASLQKQWSEIPLETDFPLYVGGLRFNVISRGVFNRGAGPDFRNAKLSIDGIVYHGDVEIHCKTSDWARHNHFNNPDYKNVVLHAVGFNDRSPASAPKLPFVPLYIFPEEYKKDASNSSTQQHGQEGLCTHFFNSLDNEDILKFVLDAGVDRLREKSHNLTENNEYSIVKIGAEKAFLLRLFELVGVPSNRAQFQALALRYLSYYPDIRANHIAAILWGESGSLPEPTGTGRPGKATPQDETSQHSASVLLQGIWNEWWSIRLKHLSPLTFNRRCRPINSVERRIAMLTLLLTQFGEYPLPAFARIIESMDTDAALKQITREYLTIRPKNTELSGFWETHTSFCSKTLQHPASLLGKSRMMELFVDAILPSLHALASIEKNTAMVKKIEDIFLALPKMPTNNIIKRTAELCFPGREDIFKTAAAQQGLLHIGKSWCERLSLDCKICPIYHLV